VRNAPVRRKTTHDRHSHWLALAGVAPISAQKSRAALMVVYNAVIGGGFSHPSDIFDSHRPLHFSLSGVLLRCLRTRPSSSSSSHSLNVATTVPEIECVDRSRSSSFSMVRSVRHRTKLVGGLAMITAEEKIRTLVDKETAAWNARDANALVSLPAWADCAGRPSAPGRTSLYVVHRPGIRIPRTS
jgi:hypothetical protein